MNFLRTEAVFHPWLPFRTLLRKEILRFLSVSPQTIVAPLISASLYLFVFGLSLGRQISLFEGITYVQFVVPGLILMGVVNNSFSNTSSSLFLSRYMGNIVDLLVTPLTASQFISAYTLAAMTRGLVVGTSVWLVSSLFTGLPWANPLGALGMILLASFLFAQFGLVAAIHSNTFDHLTMYMNFLLMPMIYLGGMFYPISFLPGIWKQVSHLNPVFYLIDGFRQSILGRGEASIALDFAVASTFAIVFFLWASTLLKRGYKLRN